MLHAIGSKKELTTQNYYVQVSDVLEHAWVQDLKLFRHHVHTTRFQHSLNVSYYSYIICVRFHWDAISAARAGLLHDLYFYETCDYDRSVSAEEESHLASHPKLALENAAAQFILNDKEADIIVHHMWPFVFHKPKCREGIVVALVDKGVAVLEYFSPWMQKIYWLYAIERMRCVLRKIR